MLDPRCIVEPEVKEWIHARASWILYQFGRERVLSNPVLTPASDHFADYEPNEAAATELLHRLALQAGFSDRRHHLWIVERGTDVYSIPHRDDEILVASQLLKEPLTLAAVIAVELCRERLLTMVEDPRQLPDLAPLSELLSVLIGMGVLTANAALRDTSWQNGGLSNWQLSGGAQLSGHDGVWSAWQIEKSGFFDMPMFGYALALYATLRSDERPAWVRHLRLDVRDAFKRTRRYFEQTGAPDLRALKSLPETLAAAINDDEEVDDTTARCRFCEARLRSHEEAARICDLCAESIEENQRELEAERVRSASSLRGIKVAIVVVIGTAAGLWWTMTLLDWALGG